MSEDCDPHSRAEQHKQHNTKNNYETKKSVEDESIGTEKYNERKSRA